MAALAWVPLLVLAGCGKTTNTGIGGTGYQAGSGNGGLLDHRFGAPDLSGPLLGGGHDDLASLRGQVVVINFYASWCSPCRAETPLLVSTAASTKGQGVAFLGVLFKDSETNGASFRQSYHETYPSLVDSDGVDLAKFKGANPSALPVTFVIDRSGRVAARWIGAISPTSNFSQVLDRLRAEPA